MNHHAARAVHASAACHRQRMEQLQPDSSSQAVITTLYIPCLRPLQLVCGSSSKRRLPPPLASPHKRVSGKKGMRCCRQLFTAADAPARTAALEFWLQTMEKVSCLCLARLSGPPACLFCRELTRCVCRLSLCRLWPSRTMQSRRNPWPEAGSPSAAASEGMHSRSCTATWDGGWPQVGCVLLWR